MIIQVCMRSTSGHTQRRRCSVPLRLRGRGEGTGVYIPLSCLDYCTPDSTSWHDLTAVTLWWIHCYQALTVHGGQTATHR